MSQLLAPSERRSARNRRNPRLAAFAVSMAILLLALPNAGRADDDDDGGDGGDDLSFARPVFVTQGSRQQAAEPSIRVDAPDKTQRIWVTAPAGIIPNSRSFPENDAGDLVWYSDDNGRHWTFVRNPAGGSPTFAGGGDSDVATGAGPEVFITGLTLADVTIAASCNRGATFVPNSFTAVPIDDRQWIDAHEDRAKPATGPDLLLTYGHFAEMRMFFHQVLAPCAAGNPTTPVSGPVVDVSGPDCVEGPLDPECYQWPGNVALDERTGDVYVTHNTLGNDAVAGEKDDVIVARIDGGGSRPVTQADVHPFVAANNRRDTFDSFTVVAVDRASNVYVVWTERRTQYKRTDTMLAISKNRGATWSKPIRVNRKTGTHTTTFPWIVAGNKGKIDIVYYGTSAAGASPETVPNSSKWRVWMAQSLNALSPNGPTFTEVPATGYMHKGSICTSGTGCAAGTRDLLDFFQLDIDRQGLANIAYTDNLNTPPDPGDPNDTGDDDPHQEWVTFVQQDDGKGLFG